jgi:hypothetical protein
VIVMRLLLVSALLSLVVAASARAVPALAPLKACYVSVAAAGDTFETEPVVVQGSGFAPGSSVNVAIDGVDQEVGVLADAGGTISGKVAAPGIASGERVFTLSATQSADLTQTASVTAKVTNLTARVKPRRSSPRRKVRFRGRGFTSLDTPVYAHYVRGEAAKARKTVTLADAPTGDCGVFSARRTQFPFRPKAGDWTVRIDQSASYPADTPAVSIAIRVRRVRG